MTFLRTTCICSSVKPADVFSGDENLSGVGLEEAHDLLQRDRFADAAAAEDAECLPRENEEADIIEDDEAAEGFRDVLEGDIGGSFLGFAVGSRFRLAVRRVEAGVLGDRLDGRRRAEEIRPAMGSWRRRSFGAAIQQEFLDPHRNFRLRQMGLSAGVPPYLKTGAGSR